MRYLEEARERARRRKSPWNALIFLVWFPLAFYLCWLSMKAGWRVHILAYPAHKPYWNVFMSEKHDSFLRWLTTILAILGPLVPNLIASALIANFVAHSIPPARRVLDAEASSVRGADYRNVQASFARYLLPATLAGYGLWLVGWLLPFPLP